MTRNVQEQINLHDKADSRSLGGTIFALGGGALLVTGIVKLAIHERDPGASMSDTAWNIGASPTGVFAFGSF